MILNGDEHHVDIDHNDGDHISDRYEWQIICSNNNVITACLTNGQPEWLK